MDFIFLGFGEKIVIIILWEVYFLLFLILFFFLREIFFLTWKLLWLYSFWREKCYFSCFSKITWILAASGAEDPDCNDRISSCNTESGMLSKTPSVAKRITSPSSTLNSYLSADSGASLSTSVANSEGGKDSWKGVLK